MKVSDISEQGRATQGVKLIKLDEGDEIAGITRLEVEEINGNGNGNGNGHSEDGADDSRNGPNPDEATNPSANSSEESPGQ